MWEKNIEQIRNNIKESFMDLSYEQLNSKPAQGEWSIAQIILHLAGAETRFMTLALEAAEQEGEAGEDVDLSVFEDLSQKLKAPIDPPEDPKSKEELLMALERSRAMTTRFLEKYSHEGLKNKSMHHHRFGKMPIWQVFELLGKHEKRHLLQIEDVKKRL
ncbi:DinB family protein [Bacillus sp. KH172YL63]|uniref:DinB family protein n=1 Tax=Bacillus sp. KH172YL63 TaxID=2709784 RepID=UPI0013E4F109|nr:DinB family protein [Bacillus sp. KH172YL63]BCB03060.1 PadR family transcriptional regulator [Bacillus sp. KH172YL63]